MAKRTKIRDCIILGILAFLLFVSIFDLLDIVPPKFLIGVESLKVLFKEFLDRTLGTHDPVCKWLRSVYQKLSDPEGLRFTITATGVLTFALSYINSARAHRVKGILIGKVIQTFYQMYGKIFIFHGVFVAFGIYSCATKVRLAGFLCAIGVSICMIYAIRMMIKTAFDGTHSEQLIKKYITLVKTNKLGKEKNKSIYAMAQYIGEQFSIEGWQYESDHSRRDDIKELLNLLEIAIPEKAKAQSEIGMLSDFELLFAPEGSSANPQYVLYSIPAVKEQVNSFLEAVRICGHMWKSMLDVLTDWQIKAKLSYLVLCEVESGSDQKRSPCTTALCCGLLFYLNESAFPNPNQARNVQKSQTVNTCQGGFTHYTYFLQHIRQLSETVVGQLQSAEQRYRVQLACKDIGITRLCLLALEQAATIRQVDYEGMCIVVQETMRFRPGVGLNEQTLCRYLCFAQIIALLSNYKSDRLTMLRNVPLVVQTVQNWLSKKPKKQKG